jgi:hypothetical protein
MQLQFSRRSDKDLDRLYVFLTEASHSIKTADKALKSIRDGAASPRYGTDLQDGTGRREWLGRAKRAESPAKTLEWACFWPNLGQTFKQG